MKNEKSAEQHEWKICRTAWIAYVSECLTDNWKVTDKNVDLDEPEILKEKLIKALNWTKRGKTTALVVIKVTILSKSSTFIMAK